ncbi:unnamed protein product (macronuclear) [Paramecium tetraurelia]|uniref:Uncharacterized protein n=1 Tax=Paramecium tetraurelia TaxID=5888 RepID=A0BK20_PARTE|nr:uncharacterized protein GSPATT00029517001 [Paramecium tetraurelia]CAK58887.1 unnamed protein product [Paramecium tetraurelia]|eukprot:XP_001426285.1 hypothetical protein (macronuclear) [Paramecium tetraurelia strain d4-2]
MDVFQALNWKQVRNKQNKRQFKLQILGRAQLKREEQKQDSVQYFTIKDYNLQPNIQRYTPQGCLQFQSKSNNKSLIDTSVHFASDNEQSRTRTPDIRVLKRKQNGKVIFQTIPKMRFPQQQITCKIDQNLVIQKLQLQTQQTVRKGLFFSERNGKRK